MSGKNTKAFAVTLALMMTIGATLIASVPTIHAQDQWYVYPIETHAFMFLSPNPIGVNQLGLIQAWISPRPMWDTGYYYNYKFTFTKPNGQIDTVTIPKTEKTGSTWFNYIPDIVGNWTVQLTWDASDTPTGPSGNHTSAATQKQAWIVQQDPIPSWPAAPLPTGPLDFPINPENREWYKLIGPWWQAEYNSSHAASNMFTQAPTTPHILWKIPPNGSMYGMIGGPYGAGNYYRNRNFGVNPSGSDIQIVMAGRTYSSWGGFIYCWDARTGELLWSAPGSGSGGTFGVSNLQAAIEFSTRAARPVLRSIGDRLIKYNPWTGQIICDVPGIGAPSAIIGDYAVSDVFVGSERRLIKWDLFSDTDDVASRIVWDVPYPFNVNLGLVWGGESDVAGGVTSDYGGDSGCINFTTGETLWIKNITNLEEDATYAMGYGKMFITTVGQMLSARDLKTGNIVWTSDPMPYPWGNFWAYSACLAYGNVYACSYAGLVSIDATTGETNWLYSSGNSMPYGETPFGTWPFYHGPLAADGKIYAGTGSLYEWNRMIYRGQQLHCVDAATGNPVWTIMGLWNPTAIAEGTLFAYSGYDGASYAFSKGTTLTEVSVSQQTTALGESVWIRGRVTDQSPAQPGTPAVSKESMKAWMEYLHMQQPQPMNTTGVPVDLYACHANGTVYKIATVTSDGQGYFRYKWTPPNEDQYTITANFMGDESYYSSWNLTSVTVGPAQQAAPDYPQAIAPIDYTPLLMGLIVAVVIVIIVGIANLFWKRK